MRGALLLALALTPLGGCGQDDPLAPPDVVLGEDICDYCHMIVMDERYLAAAVDTQGMKLLFDDIGGMVLHQRDTGTEIAAWWVHDYHSQTWIDAEGATFAHCPGLMTPMGYGVVAFGEAGDAAAFADECGGDTMGFMALLAHPLSGEEGGDRSRTEGGLPKDEGEMPAHDH